ncbi:sensor domain-containing diguanylate cyclase [Pseudoduganella chitinolytica]|uniref:Diguanylate cyclase n=1 Tax=Pseudoduganella chitinolytica TaxID=34070 RepID=A0ABY8B9S7_9BURK|nr:diguanylate cyclase [Pseudoduganella chitinolytica]WEF32687.1 diguanylate cyclase [Pseudoduganella chitinolytica]
MASLGEFVRITARRMGLSAVVFAAGLALSGYACQLHWQRSEAHQLEQLGDTAGNYASLLRQRLEQYVSATRALAAFFSASDAISREEFDNYIKASRVFDRLEGMSSFGYLPRVPAARLAAFEADAARTFPGYRVFAPRPDASDYYPLLFGQHALDPLRADRLRGIDYAAVPARRHAMQRAAAADEPVTTAMHTALRDPANRPVVLIFAPVRKAPTTAMPDAQGDLAGFIFSALYVRQLFGTFDDGRLAQQFDLEVFDGSVSAATTVFDADNVAHALQRDRDHVLAHRTTIAFGERTWLMYFYAKRTQLAAGSLHEAALVFAIGMLLTLIASYATVAWPRYASGKRAMRDFNERFAGFFEHHPFAVFALDPQGRFLQSNQQMARELGVPRETLAGMPVTRFVPKPERQAAARYFGDVMAGNAVAYTHQVQSADGRRSDLSVVMIPMSSGDTVSHVLGFAENITDRKRAEAALHASRQMLQAILDNIPQSVFWKDIDSVYQGANRSLLEAAGLHGLDQLVGKTDADLRWKDQADNYRQVDLEVIRSGVPRMRMQARDVRRDGEACWIETSKIPLKDDQGQVTGILAVTEDITARKYMEEELFRRANYDNLTGLPNRGYFNNQLDEAVKRAHRRAGLALMYFDIDRFKQVNDTYGHDVGDSVIRLFAQRIRFVLREADFVARLGGDEFVLVAEGLNEPGDAVVIAQKLVAAMAVPFDLAGTPLPVTTSIGVAWFEAGMTPEGLVKAADQAMYDAKRAGRNCWRVAGG